MNIWCGTLLVVMPMVTSMVHTVYLLQWKCLIVDPLIPPSAATSSFVQVELCVTPLSLCSLISSLAPSSFPQ